MLYSLVAGVQKYDPPLTESHNEEKRNIMHINATQLTLIAHFDLKKKMVSDKLQTAFKKALVPEVNCYFCHLPLFSFYQIKGVILRLVLKSCLRHLWFWLMYSITWEKNNYSFLRNFHVRYARRNLSASRACPVTITITKLAVFIYWLRLSGSYNDLSLGKKRFNLSYLELLEKYNLFWNE